MEAIQYTSRQTSATFVGCGGTKRNAVPIRVQYRYLSLGDRIGTVRAGMEKGARASEPRFAFPTIFFALVVSV